MSTRDELKKLTLGSFRLTDLEPMVRRPRANLEHKLEPRNAQPKSLSAAPRPAGCRRVLPLYVSGRLLFGPAF